MGFTPHTEEPDTPPRSKTVLVVGSCGRMGTMLAKRLAQAKYTVYGTDPAARASSPDSGAALPALLKKVSIVLLCVPVGAMRLCLRELAPLLEPTHLLMDITSVKTLPLAWMEKAFSGPVVGAHPMFGPQPLSKNMRVALVKASAAGAADCTDAARLFTDMGCQVFWTDAATHDAGVAMSQSLAFTISSAFFALLADQKDIAPYLTPSFKRYMEAARMHLTTDKDMFLEFGAMNPELPGAVEAFRQSLDAAVQNPVAMAAKAAQWYR